MSEPIRVLVVDDHALFRRGVVELLREQADFHVVGEAGATKEALALTQRLQPQVVLMDVHLPDARGYEIVPALKRTPGLRVLMLTVSDRDEDLLAALAEIRAKFVLRLQQPSAHFLVFLGGNFPMNGAVWLCGDDLSDHPLRARRNRDAHRLYDFRIQHQGKGDDQQVEQQCSGKRQDEEES